MNTSDTTLGFAWLVIWMAGCALAEGFWSTLLAVATGGLWSLYLVIETIIR